MNFNVASFFDRRQIAALALTLALGIVGSNFASAGETIHAKGTKSTEGAANASPARSLPLCVNDADALGEIEATQKTNAKTDFKYDGYRKYLSSGSDEELAARLVYAETQATNCESLNSQVAPLIADVVMNRVRLRKGDIKSVVYQRNQFASSLNIYDESRFREFLCPKNSALWKQSLEAVRTRAKNAELLPATAVNYYLYQHSTRFPAPNWKLKEVPPKTGTPELAKCIRFFESPTWR